MPEDWVNLATVVGGFATAIATAFALVGIPLVIFQVRSSRTTQREATAKQLYRQYLEDCVCRPDLVTPDLEKLRKEGRFTQYELFVAHMLFSLEEILENTSGSEWRSVAKGQMRRHIEYLSSDAFIPKRTYYTKDLIEVLDILLDEK
ncbi:hypothetical protein [Litorimonas haliclonae]|uniref:hypothetical protein n=1 Tax=Litorimonas haliclonae TaxID=2081977 RepID=UPI0039EEC60D